MWVYMRIGEIGTVNQAQKQHDEDVCYFLPQRIGPNFKNSEYTSFDTVESYFLSKMTDAFYSKTPPIAIGIMNTLRKFANVCPIIMPNSNSITPQGCQNFGACFLGNRLKGRQHWYELLGSYCLLFWVKEAEAPRDIHVPKVTLAVVAGQDQKKPLTSWGASFCLHTDSVVWKPTLCQHTLSGASSSLLNYNSSQALWSVLINSPRSELKHGENKFMCKIICQS